jgi:DnaK suppressor protein
MYKRIENPAQLPEDEYLSPEQVAELYNKLSEQANAMLENSLRAMNELTENQKLDPDSLDVAVSESNRELSLRLANRERRMLNKIRHAQDRIMQGIYGSCDACGVPIGYRRLLFRPVAALCIDCKTEQEQFERGRWSV